jgi:isopentenyldiphosphate isomerase
MPSSLRVQTVPVTVDEQVAMIDERGNVVGSVPRSVMRRDNLPHVVVAVLVRDSAGRIYVHRRTDTKDVFPGLHDCWVAGCLMAGEEPGPAAVRELAEELGVRGAPLAPLFTQWYADGATRHLCYAYTTTYDGPVTHQASEVAWGDWMTLAELRAHLDDPAWPMVPDGRALLETWLADGPA